MKRPLMIGVALLAVGAISACGDDDDESEVAEANTALCEDLGAYGRALADLIALDPATATKTDYDSAAGDVRSTREDMIDSAADLSEAEWENVQTQAETLVDQLRDAPDDQSVAAILDEAKPQAATVQASVATLNTAICSSGISRRALGRRCMVARRSRTRTCSPACTRRDSGTRMSCPRSVC